MALLKKICVITGSRADYGLIYWLLKEIQSDWQLKLHLIVTGAHLAPEFGLTYKDIENDGFYIDTKLEILLASDTPVSISKSMALAQVGFAETFASIQPDFLIVFGDRYEMLSAALAALIQGIPVGHIDGGELTEGAIDDAFRHAISKCARLHFTANEQYRKRVIQLGEQPESVFNVGGTCTENITKFELLEMNELEDRLGFRFLKHNLLVTFHPETIEHDLTCSHFSQVLQSLEKQKDTRIILTFPNADTNGRIFIEMIHKFVTGNDNAVSFASLGQLLYLSTLQFIDAVVGNSSSGLSEAPSFQIGTINIGDRQKGRMQAESIIDCSPNATAITNAIHHIYTEDFQQILGSVKNPYGTGNTSVTIKEIIKKWLHNGVLRKTFYDMKPAWIFPENDWTYDKH